MNVLFGVGNTLLSDDGAGIYTAGLVRGPGWESYDCGTAPENFTSIIRRLRPKMVVIVDAARMEISPGEFRVVPAEKIADVSFGTHGLPLSRLADYLSGLCPKVMIVGIEPLYTGPGEELTPVVKIACERLAGILADDPGMVPEI